LDRARRRSGRLIAFAWLGLFAAAPPAAAPPLRAMRWVEAAANPSRALLRRPTECLAAPADAKAAYEVELGRAAFRTPLLLGGQAARAGISCETCHRSGRDNPDFDFPGVSGAPGTADVTTAELSSHEADAAHGPRPIPDLSGPKTALEVSQVPGSPELEAAIDRIITREFDGPVPAPAVLGGLAAYVRALGPGACPKAASAPVSAADDLEDARRAVRAATAALAAADPAAAEMMIAAARSRLGDVAERYADPSLASERRRLAAASGDLAAAATDLRIGRKAAAGQALAIWMAAEPAWAASTAEAAPASLYDPARLRAAWAAFRAQAAGRPRSSSLN